MSRVLHVKCSPEHARLLARRAKAVDEWEIAAALEILADDADRLHELERRIELGRHSFEMLRHWLPSGRMTAVVAWADTFAREGRLIFSGRARG